MDGSGQLLGVGCAVPAGTRSLTSQPLTDLAPSAPASTASRLPALASRCIAARIDWHTTWSWSLEGTDAPSPEVELLPTSAQAAVVARARPARARDRVLDVEEK